MNPEQDHNPIPRHSVEQASSDEVAFDGEELDRLEWERQQQRYAEEKAAGIVPKTGRAALKEHFGRSNQQLIHPEHRG